MKVEIHACFFPNYYTRDVEKLEEHKQRNHGDECAMIRANVERL
jgi:hypothetical protein